MVRIAFAFTRDLADQIPFGSAILTRLGSLLKMVPFGSDPKKVSCKRLGSDRNRYGRNLLFRIFRLGLSSAIKSICQNVCFIKMNKEADKGPKSKVFGWTDVETVLLLKVVLQIIINKIQGASY